MPYVDPNTVHNPATSTVAPASWGDVIRDDLEFLIDPPGCSIYNSTTVNVSDDTLTALTADTERFDNDAMHSTVSNTSRITIQTAGRYLLTSTISFDATGTGYRQGIYKLNGTTFLLGGQIVKPVDVASIDTALSWAQTWTFAAGDYVETFCRHTAGGANAVQLQEFAALYLTR